MLRQLASLTELDVAGNLFQAIDKDAIPVSGLQKLDLSRNTLLQVRRSSDSEYPIAAAACDSGSAAVAAAATTTTNAAAAVAAGPLRGSN